MDPLIPQEDSQPLLLPIQETAKPTPAQKSSRSHTSKRGREQTSGKSRKDRSSGPSKEETAPLSAPEEAALETAAETQEVPEQIRADKSTPSLEIAAEAAETLDASEAPETSESTEEATPKDETPRPTPVTSGEPLTLEALVETVKTRRLTPSEEEKATEFLKELLANNNKAGISAALEPLVQLPWIVSVTAVGALWQDLKPIIRRYLLASLAKDESDQALRLRFSLARALWKIDPAAGLKIATGTVSSLKTSESGTLQPKHRQIFFHVFIGKGKPWILQLPLAELKAPEAERLIHCAIETFPFCPPLSQLSLLRWINAGGYLLKLAPGDLSIAAKSVSRWNGKLQRQLRNDIPELPEGLTSVLKPDRGVESPKAAPSETVVPSEQETEAEESEAAEESEGEAPAASEEDVERTPEAKRPEGRSRGREGREGRENRESREREPRDERTSDKDQRERRSESRTSSLREERGGKKPFDFKESLRGLESYVNSLRTELEQTKTQLRRKEDDSRQRRRGGFDERPSVDVETLTRHNAQLEETVQLLRQQLEDLASHHEAVAESRELHSDAPLPEGSSEQLKSLLSIKLQESFEAYSAMRLDPLDRVFRLDYRDLLGNVFDVLLAEGVKLTPESTKDTPDQ